MSNQPCSLDTSEVTVTASNIQGSRVVVDHDTRTIYVRPDLTVAELAAAVCVGRRALRRGPRPRLRLVHNDVHEPQDEGTGQRLHSMRTPFGSK